MYFRTLLSGTLAVFLLSAGGAAARESDAERGLFSLPSVSSFLPGVFGSADEEEPATVVAQSSDPRVIALEEQVRSLNGTVEELNFQILQLQEQLRKMQEDNEFRFQELEQKSEAGGRKDRVASTTPAQPREAGNPPAPGGSVEDIIAGETTAATPPAGTDGPGEPPKSFGNITFDADGNATESGAPAPQGGEAVAALPPSDNPEELYRNAYQFILSGDYATAESGFRDHIGRFPEDGRAADAHFWLGEALLGQKKYRDAAETFLAASKNYPKAKKAPDMLLKLGVSLVALNQREVACATFGEISRRYPGTSAALKERVKQEQASASC
jgi:tol-pal system protein YbgF